MTVESNLVTAITGQFSGRLGNRVFPNHIPESAAYPAMKYTTIDDPEEGTLNEGTTKLSHPRIQFSYFGKSANDRNQFRDDFRAFMASFSDSLIQAAKIVNINDGSDPEADLYFCHIDCIIWYTRT